MKTMLTKSLGEGVGMIYLNHSNEKESTLPIICGLGIWFVILSISARAIMNLGVSILKRTQLYRRITGKT